MTNQELYGLIDRFEGSTLSRLKLTQEGLTIELERGGAPAPAPSAPVSGAAAPAAPAPAPEAPAIKAPLVGTFYASPAPDQPPFVRVGDRVARGETVCLLEAMKMMSEVPAPCDLVIEAVEKENGQLAAFGEPLFRYRAVGPC